MGWGFRKSIKIAPGVKLNIGKKGISTTVGPRGATISVGKRGAHLNTSIPGTGLFSRTQLVGPTKQKPSPKPSPKRRIAKKSIPDLTISIAKIEHIKDNHYRFEFSFCCKKCGCTTVQLPDDQAAHGPVKCDSCRTVFGGYGAVMALANQIGRDELKRRGLV